MKAASHTLHHVGEWKVELSGETVEDLFVELARVLANAAAGGDSWTEGPESDLQWHRVALMGPDHATLLVDWANELIGLGEVDQRAYGYVRNLSIEPMTGDGDDVHLHAEIGGRAVQSWVSPVKAATYHGAVVEHDGEWRAVVLLDV